MLRSPMLRLQRGTSLPVSSDVTAGPKLCGAGSALIAVFAKLPRPGSVKTRMSPPFSPEQAAALYSAMLDDVLATTGELARRRGLDAVVCCHPEEGCREIALRAPEPFRVVAQRGRDLASRMSWAVAEAAAGGATRILLRGSDSPAMEAALIEEALESLEECDVTVCPDADGGYGLVGLRGPAPGLFDHPMSTASVLQDTLSNAASLGLDVRTMEPSFDLDTAADLARLEQVRETQEIGQCPRTLAYLDDHELWRLAAGARA
jgi:rSAM/selenodomain-associated transferase 1